MKEELKRLYGECFPEDSAPCAEIILDYLSSAERFVLTEGGKLRSALYLVDKKLFYRGKISAVSHIVGLGTFIRDRKKGYAERLIKKVLNESEKPFVTLYPFNHAFYEKYGFAAVSFDFPPSGENKGMASAEEAEKCYRLLCGNLDYSFVREKKDFDFYEKVFAADGESYVLTTDGIDSPDGFLPFTYRLTDIKGVMARIADIFSAMRLTKVTCDIPITVTDPIIEKNNISFTLSDGEIIPCERGEITVDIGKLTEAVFGKSEILKGIFPPLNGYLADKY